MKLTILGSGTGVAHPKRNSPGYLLQVGAKNILIEAGEGISRRLMEAGLQTDEIDYIFITHTHTDHTTALPALIWGYFWQEKPRQNDLLIIGPRGFKKYYNQIKKLFFPDFQKVSRFKIYLKEVKNSQLRFGNFHVSSYKMMNNQNTPVPLGVGYRISSKDKTIAFTGDTGLNKNLIKLAKESDLFVCEAAKARKYKDHLTPTQAGEIAQKAHAKKLLLTHFYPEVERIDIKKEARKFYQGPIILARDLMSLKI